LKKVVQSHAEAKSANKPKETKVEAKKEQPKKDTKVEAKKVPEVKPDIK
jgi:hypothetical protein